MGLSGGDAGFDSGPSDGMMGLSGGEPADRGPWLGKMGLPGGEEPADRGPRLGSIGLLGGDPASESWPKLGNIGLPGGETAERGPRLGRIGLSGGERADRGPCVGRIGLSGGDLRLDGEGPRSGISMCMTGRTGAPPASSMTGVPDRLGVTPYSFIVGRRTRCRVGPRGRPWAPTAAAGTPVRARPSGVGVRP